MFLQYVNGEAAVLHCHHYATIFTKLALTTPGLNGPQNLFDAMEETSYLTLHRYFLVEDIKGTQERKSITQQYYALAGLGYLTLDVDMSGGRASMRHSHVDEGWIKKWGKNGRPVNHMGRGYIAGALSAVFGESVGTYHVRETQSIVTGAATSEFTIKRK